MALIRQTPIFIKQLFKLQNCLMKIGSSQYRTAVEEMHHTSQMHKTAYCLSRHYIWLKKLTIKKVGLYLILCSLSAI